MGYFGGGGRVIHILSSWEDFLFGELFCEFGVNLIEILDMLVFF